MLYMDLWEGTYIYNWNLKAATFPDDLTSSWLETLVTEWVNQSGVRESVTCRDARHLKIVKLAK